MNRHRDAGKPPLSRFPGPLQCSLLALLPIGPLHYFLPLGRLVPRHRFWPGTLLFLSGLVIANLAAVRLSRAGIGLDSMTLPAALLTGGLYARSRNPLYLGLLLLLAGEAMMLGTLGAFLTWPLLYLVLRYRYVVAEERQLAAAFGHSWDAYRQRVRRWF